MAARIPKGMKLVGPFPHSKPPVRTGVFLRKSKTGRKEWAYFKKGVGWGTYSSSIKNAIAKFENGARSTKQRDWWGFEKVSA